MGRNLTTVCSGPANKLEFHCQRQQRAASPIRDVIFGKRARIRDAAEQLVGPERRAARRLRAKGQGLRAKRKGNEIAPPCQLRRWAA